MPSGQVYSQEAGHLPSCLPDILTSWMKIYFVFQVTITLDVFSAQKRQTSGTAIYSENEGDSPQSKIYAVRSSALPIALLSMNEAGNKGNGM